jgi:membrane protein implicated in regulation of membrane protease activity
MDDRETPTPLELILEIGVPLFWAFVSVSPAILLAGSSTPEWLYGLIGAIYAAILVWYIVRWINRRGDPRRAKHPPDAP